MRTREEILSFQDLNKTKKRPLQTELGHYRFAARSHHLKDVGQGG